jgi:branched-chain amino acid transport system permease protein
MDPTILAQLLVFGLLIGSVYGLVALGLTMIWGVMGVVNVAHGALMVIGMYAVWYGTTVSGVNPVLVIPLVALLLFGIGIAIHRSTIHPFMEESGFNNLIVTVAWLLILTAAIQIVFSPTPRRVEFDYEALELFGVFLPAGRLFGLAITVTTVAVMVVFLEYTHLGRAIRATADNRNSAKYVGLNVNRVDYLTFGIGAALAGVAGAVIPFIQRFDPYTGEFYLVIAFIVSVLGGLGSFYGALLGGILIGLIEVFGAFYLPGSTNQILIFIVFILVLLFRPRGIGRGSSHD